MLPQGLDAAMMGTEGRSVQPNAWWPMPRRDTGRIVAIGIAVAGAYVLSARLGFQVAFVAEQVTTVWAPTGIAQAALLLWGRRLWPAIWLGAFAANLGTEAPAWTAAAIASGNTLEAVAAAWALRVVSTFDPGLRRFADAARFIVIGALLATTISASIGVTALCVAGVQPWSRFSGLWSAWWLGDVLGALVVAPVLLTLVRSTRDTSRRGWLTIALLVCASMATTLVAFEPMLGPILGRGPLHYVVFPIAVVTAVRFGQPATALAIFAASAVAIWNTLRGSGPFASPDVFQGLILLQTFIGILAGTGLLLAAAMAERHTGQRRRGAAHAVANVLADAPDLTHAAPAILRDVCEHLGWQIGALWLVDPDGQRISCFAAWGTAATPADEFLQATRAMQFKAGVGLPGRVWAAGRAAWIEDVWEDQNFPRAMLARRAGVHGAFGCPIRLGGDLLGVIEFFTYRVTTPDVDLLDTMSTVGHQVGQFIGRKRLEAAMGDEQRRIRAILGTALDAVIAMDHRGVITEFNPAAERIFGYSRDTAIGRELAELLIPADLRALHREGLARYLATGEGRFLNRRVETRGRRADGHEFPIEISIAPVSDEGPARFTGFVRDLSARVDAEEAMRVSAERFRSLAASNSALTLYEQDRDLRYQWVFPQHPEFADQNIGKTDLDLLPPGEGERLTALKRAVLETGHGRREEITVTLPADTRSYDLMIEPRRDGTGAIIGVSGVAVDITERKRSERLLLEHNNVLELIATGHPAGACLLAVSGAASRLSAHARACVLVADTDPTTFAAAYAAELPAAFLHELQTLSAAAPAVGAAVLRGDAVTCEDIAGDDRWSARSRAACLDAGIRACHFEPAFTADGVPAGAFMLCLDDARAPSTAELRIAQFGAHMASIVIERERTEATLRNSEERLKEADRRKDEFLAMLAHELRNPLAPIRTGLEVVRLAGDTPGAIERIRPMMERQVGHMVRLIDDLLDVSRITSGKIHLQRQVAHLADLVDGAVEANRAAIEAARIALTVQLPDGPTRLLVDPTRFVQVISNLLHNAAKFTDAGGRILVAGQVVQDGSGQRELVLSVADTGIGISGQMLPRVFDLFIQGERPATRPHAGLGIGLALARRIVEMHGGRIDARSEGPGRGSEFTIRMPVIDAAADLLAGAPPPGGRRALERRVLIVDDNVDAAEALASLVRALGGEARTATNGMDGIRLAAAFEPDVILLDIGMPGLDGYETCRLIREAESGAHTLIVAITGWGQARDKRRAVEAGFDAHLTKPADPAALEQLLANAAAVKDDGADRDDY